MESRHIRLFSRTFLLLLSDFESTECSGGESTEGGGTGGDDGGGGDSVVVVVDIPDMMPGGEKERLITNIHMTTLGHNFFLVICCLHKQLTITIQHAVLCPEADFFHFFVELGLRYTLPK